MSLSGFIKSTLNVFLSPLKIEVVRKGGWRERQAKAARLELKGALQQLQREGFSPVTVIDVGAGVGTPALFEVFPKARHVWIEPLEENRAALEQLARNLPHTEII